MTCWQANAVACGAAGLGANATSPPTLSVLAGLQVLVPLGSLIRTLRNLEGLVSVLLVVLGWISGWFWVGSVWLMNWLC